MKNNAPQKKIILTGDRPTGKLHIGHYVGSLRRRVELQNSGAFDEIYIMIADTQALTDNFGVPQKVRDKFYSSHISNKNEEGNESRQQCVIYLECLSVSNIDRRYCHRNRHIIRNNIQYRHYVQREQKRI